MMRKTMESSPFLFYIWYHVVRKHGGIKINYFGHSTKFLLDGYPRSGNTFATSLCKKTFGNNIFVHHFHALAPVKIALKRNIPVFILMREPEEAITSYYLKYFSLKHREIPKEINRVLLKDLTDQYSFFYKYILKHKNRLEIIEFQKLIHNPKHLIFLINELVYQNKLEICSSMLDNAINSYCGAKDTYGSSKPNFQKENLKSVLKKDLLGLPQYEIAIKTYQSFF